MRLLGWGLRGRLALAGARLRQTVLAQQAAELVIAQTEQLGRGGLLELRALERAPQHAALERRDRGAKVRRHLVVARARRGAGLDLGTALARRRRRVGRRERIEQNLVDRL